MFHCYRYFTYWPALLKVYLLASAYTKGLMLLYLVINPTLFTTRSRDLLQALGRRLAVQAKLKTENL